MPATFTTAQARDQGLTSRNLAAFVAADEIEELSRGVYWQTDAPASAHLDLLGVQQFEAAPGETVPVYSPAGAAVDGLRLGGPANRPPALSALNRYLLRYGTGGVAELRDTAQHLGVLSRIRPSSRRRWPDAESEAGHQPRGPGALRPQRRPAAGPVRRPPDGARYRIA
jgi:hypothetical protein